LFALADPKYRQIVPMRFFNLTLTAPEAEAYNAGFLEEKVFERMWLAP